MAFGEGLFVGGPCDGERRVVPLDMYGKPSRTAVFLESNLQLRLEDAPPTASAPFEEVRYRRIAITRGGLAIYEYERPTKLVSLQVNVTVPKGRPDGHVATEVSQALEKHVNAAERVTVIL